jgi:glycosyltransferase involved in cell wall biosynthesis
MKKTNHKATIVYLTTFPPRECGIATFTSDLIDNFDKLYAKQEETKVVALAIDSSQKCDYPSKVIAEVLQEEPEDYKKAAEMLNAMPEVELVAVEHEYGIYGKDHGSNLLVFLDEIKKPVTVTCHTVLPNPPKEMKEVMQRIIARADRLIVMTQASKVILEEIYGAPTEKVKVISHGIHPVPFTDGTEAKKSLGLSGKKIISTFGFLSRGKGIEYGIEAMPEIVKQFPDAVYLVIGETHPVVKKREGEGYRKELEKLAKDLKIEDHVVFYDRYLATEDLLEFLEATDIYLSLSQNPDQAVSGTLSYALGAGRPVISTPFAQAKEIITPDVGALVELGTSEGIIREVSSLFSDKKRRESLAKNAYFRTRSMTWPNVALSYMREFAVLAPELAKKEKVVPVLNLSHLIRLTDDFGVFQFAILNEPDPAWGYTLDDNARALIVMAWCANASKDVLVAKKLAKEYLRFIDRAGSRDGGGFINYFDAKREPHEKRNTEENLEDANARALWALAETAVSRLPFLTRLRARILFHKHSEDFATLRSPRAAAFVVKACAVMLAKRNNRRLRKILVDHADFLLSIWNESSNGTWQWFEESITYSNAVLPEALLLAHEITGDEAYKQVGKSSLDFLMSYSFEGDVTVPVGQAGWLKRGGKKHLYDQQPEEVSALVLALCAAYRVLKHEEYENKMEQAFNWFLGNNTLNQVVYLQMTGGSYDGLGEKEVNLNQGAESTVSYLLARLAMEPAAQLQNK